MAGCPVGKSDCNENPVVSPDLDLDFGLRLRVCQFVNLVKIIFALKYIIKTRMTKVNYKLRVYLGLGCVLTLLCVVLNV